MTSSGDRFDSDMAEAGSQRATLRRRFWAEVGLASLTGGLFVLTVFWHNWIEAVFRVDPDHGDGLVEFVVVAGLAATTAVLGFAARLEWRRPPGSLVPPDPRLAIVVGVDSQAVG